jgi:hypothetical protein
MDHATEYARRMGWSVDPAYVFVDDGISGAEFANRPGFLRLMNAVRCSFGRCTAAKLSGTKPGSATMRMARADDAFLASIGGQVLSPSICEAVIDGVYEALQPAGIAPERERRERELAAGAPNARGSSRPLPPGETWRCCSRP